MPVNYQIDSERQLVVTRMSGVLKDPEVFEYQNTVWGRPDVAGFNEVVDMSGVTHVLLPSIERVRDLADLATEMSRNAPPTRTAIAAPRDLQFGLARMFEQFREAASGGKKAIGVFRTVEEAFEWLGIESPLQDQPQAS